MTFNWVNIWRALCKYMHVNGEIKLKLVRCKTRCIDLKLNAEWIILSIFDTSRQRCFAFMSSSGKDNQICDWVFIKSNEFVSNLQSDSAPQCCFGFGDLASNVCLLTVVHFSLSKAKITIFCVNPWILMQKHSVYFCLFCQCLSFYLGKGLLSDNSKKGISWSCSQPREKKGSESACAIINVRACTFKRIEILCLGAFVVFTENIISMES